MCTQECHESDTAVNTSIYTSILTKAHVALALRLMAEKDSLPGAGELFTHRPHEPLHCWSDQQLESLQSPSLVLLAREERECLKQLHASAQGAEISSHPPLDVFLAAVDAVRMHSLPCSGSLVLAPATVLLARSVPRGATAMLHGTTRDLVIKGDGSGGLAVSAGWLTNDELLLSQGWALADSATQVVALPEDMLWSAANHGASTAPPVCQVSPEEWEGPVTLASREAREKVIDALRKFRYIEAGDELTVLAGGLCSDPLGNFMQVLCLSEDEVALFGEQGCAVNIGESVPISRRHETRYLPCSAIAMCHVQEP